jgi:4-cresol dehydrogenase (hydroxylating) flavoprotein subunit
MSRRSKRRRGYFVFLRSPAALDRRLRSIVTPDVDGALDEFRAALGREHVLAGDAIAPFSRATFPTSQHVVGVLRPGDRDEVAACVRIANARKLFVYPVSQGKNWGYGSRVPVRSGCLIIDLGRMTRILETNEELAYAIVEPGVTFTQLHEHLVSSSSRLVATVTGATPNSSVVANALERGIGKGTYGDRFSSVCNFEVVVPTGEIIETGFGRFDGAKAAHVARASVGPHVDGLFSQSGFGIVTRMTVWLRPRPSHLQTFFYRIDSEEQLGPLIDVLRELRLEDALGTPFLLGNSYRHISFAAQYPWSATNGATPMPPDVLAEMKARNRIGAWMGEGALFSNSAAQAAAEKDYIEQRLGPVVDELEFWDEARARRGAPTRLVADPANVWDRNPYRGFPIAASSFMTYWRKKTPPPADMDPDRDACGVLWFSPALPARGDDARAVASIVEEVVHRHGYEPNMGFNFLTARCIYMTGALVYDREVPGEDAKAMACYEELVGRLVASGYHPYRLGIQSMRVLDSDTPYDDFLGALKYAIDPNGVLAPGRYEPKGR